MRPAQLHTQRRSLPRQSKDGAVALGSDITSGHYHCYWLNSVSVGTLVWFGVSILSSFSAPCCGSRTGPPSSASATVLKGDCPTKFHSRSFAKQGVDQGLRTQTWQSLRCVHRELMGRDCCHFAEARTPAQFIFEGRVRRSCLHYCPRKVFVLWYGSEDLSLVVFSTLASLLLFAYFHIYDIRSTRPLTFSWCSMASESGTETSSLKPRWVRGVTADSTR